MNKIYFAGSIRGGRNDHLLYKHIISHLQGYGEVVTEHVGDEAISQSGEDNMSDREIYDRDLAWLTSSAVVVAEVTTPSLGVGFEIARAAGLHKKILCLYRVPADRKLSAMISGCPEVTVAEYRDIEDVKQIIDDFLNSLIV
jgi:hypothetical protein